MATHLHGDIMRKAAKIYLDECVVEDRIMSDIKLMIDNCLGWVGGNLIVW